MEASSQRSRLAHFAAHTHTSRIHSTVRYESSKEAQLKFLKQTAKYKEELVKRTVVVDNVHDVKTEKSRKKLSTFFRRYGAVAECIVARYVGKKDCFRIMNPAARVVFQYESSAANVLKMKRIPYPEQDCTDGKGFITVKKSNSYDITKKKEVVPTLIELRVDRLSLGHYIPNEEHDSNLPWRINRDNTAQEEWLEEHDMKEKVQIRIDLAKKYIELEAPRHYRSDDTFDFSSASDYATIYFKSLWGPIDICRCDGSERYSLVLALKYPPKFQSDSTSVGLGFAVEDQDLERERNLRFCNFKASLFGQCLGLKLDLDEKSVEELVNSKALKRLKDIGMIRETFQSAIHARTVAIKQIGMADQAGRAFVLDQLLEELHQWNATVAFLLRSVLDRGNFTWYDARHDTVLLEAGPYNLFELLTFLISTEKSNIAIQALSGVLKSYERTRFPCRLLYSLVQDPVVDFEMPEHCVAIPRVLLTPTRQIATGLEVETSNRVVREYVENHGFSSDRFLRVNISDENGRKHIWFDLTVPLQQRIRNCVLPGLVVNGRLFQFLAYSSSQLKECSMWMVNLDDTTTTVQAMRQNMGDFSKCQTPSKVAARMGQCFSTTFRGLCGHDSPPDVGPNVRHVQIKDIVSSRENSVHSDGNGLIRRSAMTKLLQNIPSVRDGTELNHSIVQIRYGGAKGTLVAWDDDDFDSCLASSNILNPSVYDVAIRDSMVKFDARYEQLEVCSAGSDAPYYLNRNVILLLNYHGVDDKIFVMMQRKMLDDLDSMLKCPLDARRMISRLGGPDQFQRTRLLHTLRCGVSPSDDPFVFACCLAIRAHHLFGLRKKARIHVKDGSVLMGGIDVLNVLPEFCVFLQVRKCRDGTGDTNGEADVYEPIAGPVMVTKHPVMHPGDVRMLLAVDVPALRRHKNVLLFSQRGHDPEADKMGGSDLDGDEYAVSWDTRLFFGEWNNSTRDKQGRFVSKKKKVLPTFGTKAHMNDFRDAGIAARVLQGVNFKPLCYEKPALNLGEALPVNDEGLVEHFLHFARNDNLGQIAMMWQDWASSSGAGCVQCIELAKQHAIAVDFGKTGIPASVPNIAQWRKQGRAHWREKKNEPTYHCLSVIGMLYDEVTIRSGRHRLETFTIALAGRPIDIYGQVLSTVDGDNWAKTNLQRVYNDKVPSKLGWIDSPTGFDKKLQDHLTSVATELRFVYEEEVVKAMHMYELRSEGELYTGCIRKFHSVHKSRQYDVANDVRRRARVICVESRSMFFKHVLDVVRASNIVPLSRGAPPPPGFTTGTVQLNGAAYSIHTNFAQLLNRDVPDDVSPDDRLEVEELSTRTDMESDARSWMIRTIARKLAAAGYMVTYSPWREVHADNAALFGFPWIVADVMSCGIQESESATP